MTMNSILEYKYFGMLTKGDKYLLCMGGSLQYNWVSAYGTWCQCKDIQDAIDTALRQELFIFESAEELYQWMGDKDA